MRRRLALWSIAIICAITASLAPLQARAEDMDVNFYSANDILFYHPNDKDCAPGTTQGNGYIVDPNNKDNLDTILRFIVGKGLSLAAAAGIAGNLQQESGFNPRIIQGGAMAPDNYTPVNSVGFGIVQWTWTDRQAPLAAKAKEMGKPITDLGVQLEFMWYEMNNNHKKDTLEPLMAIKDDPVKAAVVFHKGFERSADAEEFVARVRGGNATKIYQANKGKIQESASSVTATSSSSSSNSCTQTGTGGASSGDTSSASFVTPDGFAVYDQTDPRWSKLTYITQQGTTNTVGPYGCGIMALAMGFNFVLKKAVNIPEMVKQASDERIMLDGIGMSFNTQTRFEKYYPVKITPVAPSIASINSILKAGGVVFVAGTGRQGGQSPFYDVFNHYEVIRGITDKGNWLMGDSNGQLGKANSNNMEGFDPNIVLAHLVYANATTLGILNKNSGTNTTGGAKAL